MARRDPKNLGKWAKRNVFVHAKGNHGQNGQCDCMEHRGMNRTSRQERRLARAGKMVLPPVPTQIQGANHV